MPQTRDKSASKLSKSFGKQAVDPASCHSPASDESDETAVSLIKDVISSLLTSGEFVSLVKHHIDTSLAKVTSAVETNTAEIHDLNVKLDQISIQIDKMSCEMTKMCEANVKYQHQINNLEQYTRRNSIRILGVPSSPEEHTTNLVIDLIADKLDIELTDLDIDRTHRVGKPTGDSPRAILVKFVRHDIKSKVIKARRHLKGTKIVIKEDLTVQNQILLRSVKTSEVTSNAWSWDGKIFCTKTGSGKIHSIHSTDDLKKL